MKSCILLSSLLATLLFVMPIDIFSRVPVNQNASNGKIPQSVLRKANEWMYEHALPYTRIHSTFINLGKGVWAFRWTWQIASGVIYDATLIIKNNGQLINDPVIDELAFWPF